MLEIVMSILKWYSIILLIILELSTLMGICTAKKKKERNKMIITSVAMLPILVLSILA